MIGAQVLDEDDHEISSTLAGSSAFIYIQNSSIWASVDDFEGYSTLESSLAKTVHHKEGHIIVGIVFSERHGGEALHVAWSPCNRGSTLYQACEL